MSPCYVLWMGTSKFSKLPYSLTQFKLYYPELTETAKMTVRVKYLLAEWPTIW